MNKESLIKAKNIIVSAIFSSNINAQDKTELMINLAHFLNENTYDKQIKILRKEKFKK